MKTTERSGDRRPARRWLAAGIPFMILLAAVSYAGVSLIGQTASPEDGSSRTRPVRRDTVVWHRYEVVASFPHDSAAFTQGFEWNGDRLYEGTGRFGASSLRRTNLETGVVEQQVDLAPSLFGEGITIWDDSIIQVTWQNRAGFVYDLGTFDLRRTFTYTGEGWGLTHDDRHVIMSNGTSTLTFRDPVTLQATGYLDVTLRGRPLGRLNELEYIEGRIWANVWPTNQIVIIDPTTGRVTGVLDLTGLLTPEDQGSTRVDVLNGIAYDRENDRILVTGKYWPKVYQIRIQ